ncbi:MAG: TolC family protein [Sideroxyarcus sp.]|nr:TolC family protein [Sideroxyarcus sp.]
MLSITYLGIVQAEQLTLTEALALTEREAVNGALSRPAWMEGEAGRVAVAESVVTETGLMPNPVFAVSRDRLGMAGGDITERSVQISQTFDFSGRRSLRHEAAIQRQDAEKYDGQIRRLSTIDEVRRTFAETLHRIQIQSALGLWLTRLESVSKVTAQLAKAGEASGYNRRRIEREAQTVKARLSVAQADAARSRETLAALTGKKPDEVMRLLGDLLPDVTPALDVLKAGLNQRPDLASLLSQAKAFERERMAAERGWVPDLTVGVGQKYLTEPTRSGSGAIVGVSFSIPLFDRSQAAQQRSLAKAQTIRSEHALALTRADAELRGAWRQADELRKAVIAYRYDVSNGSQNLSGIAEVAYRAGEAGLLELLDAYRTELDFSTTELDLALRARLAHIDLETLSGVSSYE